ncbi:AAA domain-containing protein [Alicyclobacillus hesperidum]|uniref:AAA domain-containing protein n=1 Tax=Alicyclobacillus hesperidum TaxID=89784 RepID=A0A1H2WWL7_9BACL|nr:AAA domain-containing protein [Alicyclobacillus hesperidum]
MPSESVRDAAKKPAAARQSGIHTVDALRRGGTHGTGPDRQSVLRQKLQEARRDLLDLTLRNNMLNFRLPKSQGVYLDHQPIDEVYKRLVGERLSLNFFATVLENKVPDEAVLDGEAENSEKTEGTQAGAPDDGSQVQGTVAGGELTLSAPYTANQLNKRLLNTFRTARTSLEEQGANTLFLAMGFLEWYESESSDKPLMAPLVLVPVTLERDTARDRFTVRYSEEEVVANLSLQYKLKIDFGIELPELEVDDERSLSAYIDSISETVAKQERWIVHADRLLMAFFSFGKYLMFRDLEADLWPDVANPLNHDILASLLVEGFREEPSDIDELARLDDTLPLTDMQTVMDADSSQLAAVVDVARGRNLVIQGPPGTGKSQTITNVIARAVLDGKSVLFVAEKMAALEVVKSRLEKVGLGAACLELHSNKTNKRQLLTELERTWQLRGTAGVPETNELEYKIQRSKLNEYIDVLHQPMGGSGVTPYIAMGQLIRWQERMIAERWPAFDVDTNWTRELFVERRDFLRDLQAFLKEIGVPVEHPFWGCALTETPTGAHHEALVSALTHAVNAVGELAARWENAKVSLSIQGGDAWPEVDAAVQVLRLLSTVPDLAGVDVRDTAWADFATWVDTVKAMQSVYELKAKYETLLLADTWTKDLAPVRTRILAHQSFFGRMSGEYKSARAQAMACLRSPQKQSEAEMLAWLNDVIYVQQTQERVMQHEVTLAKLLGGKWRGVDTDWKMCAEIVGWMVNLQQLCMRGEIPGWVVDLLVRPDIREAATGTLAILEPAVAEARSTVRVAVEKLQYRRTDVERGETTTNGLNGGSETAGLTDSIAADDEQLRRWQGELDTLSGIVRWNLFTRRCDKVGLGSVVHAAASWRYAGDSLVDAVTYRWYEALLQVVFKQHPTIAEFAGNAQWGTVERFRALDEEMTRITQKLAAAAHLQRIPSRESSGGELGLLRREMQKKGRHMAIRQLLARTGHAIQALKPVFMASPMSVATFFPPGSLHFDLVVFDEASQVQPVDALGAIIRGRQLVVVGDSKQLPPTNFFDAAVDDEEDPEDTDVHTSDMESILSLCVSQGMPERMLRWHYRSRHESLIALSNAEFYDGRLILFPSPERKSTTKGLVLHRLEDTAYDRGKSRTNRLEARAVAQAVMEHARAFVNGDTDETLGVVALSSTQAEAIEDEVDRLRRANPSCEPFFAASDEPFFVKNLETVQGDERDVIFVSVGYGRDKDGYLAMTFGPLGKAGGERRLNVLITRARVRCEVFTNLRSEDIDLHRAKGEGSRVFKAFLRYCETGKLDLPHSTGREADSPFEEAVRDELVRLGYQVDVQVGSAGFFIDLAVVDPDAPGRYLIGIECDGATYHSSRSARDRDRLRQQVLEGLGWTLHRIWSTDWFRDRKKALAKLVAAIEEAKVRAKRESLEQTERPKRANTGFVESSTLAEEASSADAMATSRPRHSEAVQEIQASAAGAVTEPYVAATLHIPPLGVELHEVAIGQWANWIAQVVEIESPVHVEVVVRRIADACGIKRIGKRIRATYGNAVRYAVSQQLVKMDGDILLSPSLDTMPIRSRADVPTYEKQMEYIAQSEIAAVMMALIDRAYGYSEESLIVDTGRALGFSRVTQDMRDILSRVFASLQNSGRVRLEGVNYVRAGD